MEQISFYVTAVSFALIILFWFGFSSVFIFRKKPESAPDSKNAPKSFLGLALQGVGFMFVWSVRRQPLFSPVIKNQFIFKYHLADFRRFARGVFRPVGNVSSR